MYSLRVLNDRMTLRDGKTSGLYFHKTLKKNFEHG